jgi:hypothetical protein
MKYTMDADLLKLIKKDKKNQKVCSCSTYFVVICMVFSGEVFIYIFNGFSYGRR